MIAKKEKLSNGDFIYSDRLIQQPIPKLPRYVLYVFVLLFFLQEPFSVFVKKLKKKSTFLVS